jgi:hypothetical protein
MINSASTDDSSFINNENKENILDQDQEEKDKEKEFKNNNNAQSPRKVSNFQYQCFIRNIFEKFGSLFIFDKNNLKIFISKLRIVNFPMKKVIFERGKISHPKSDNIDSSSIPEIKFWNQRYYYYSKFDEGIKMDYESKFY